ncbi:hypothetical protein E4T56_gene17410 [Termitomyces sp. T112]|nr:hypothetical protein E4T56_gene17410 [Termitomyces sp. T112]
MVSEYEKEKARNIERNAAILRSLGLHKPLFEPLYQRPKETKSIKKRKASIDIEESNSVAKVARVEPSVSGRVRRSTRTSGKKVDYTAEQQRSAPLPIMEEAKPRRANTSQVRRYDPKKFGAIPDVEIGSWWATRMECSRDAIHAPTVAGISGGPEGAYSVALSGGYEDDVDLGYAFTYTGSGGRALKGTKAAPKNLRTAPQSSDQTFDNPVQPIFILS